MIGVIGETLARTTWGALSTAGRERAKLCLVANLSAAVAGVPHVRLPEPAACGGGSARGHMLFSGRRTNSAREAAFWNAAVMHARTQDDMNPVCNLHAGTVAIPAAIAATEAVFPRRVDGRAFLDAVTAGYAAASGAARAVNGTTTPKGLRSTGLYTPFAAAAAAAHIVGFDAAAQGNAIALTASLASGISQCWIDGSDEWQLHVAQATANGLLAVELTRGGVKGGAHALDGAAGFYRALAGAVPEALATDAGVAAEYAADRAVLETLLKRYPVSGIVQPVAFLAERMAARRVPGGGDIERIVITMNPFEMRYPGTLNQGPYGSFSAVLMSVPFACASVLAQGRFSFADLAVRSHPARDRLIAATEVRDDAVLPSLSCRIDLHTAGGRVESDAIPDGSREPGLAIDASSIDDWAGALWEEAGHGRERYAAFRAVVDDLERRDAAELLATLPGGLPA